MPMWDHKKFAQVILNGRGIDRAGQMQSDNENSIDKMTEPDESSEADTAFSLAGEAFARAITAGDGAGIARAFKTLKRLCDIADDEDY